MMKYDVVYCGIGDTSVLEDFQVIGGLGGERKTFQEGRMRSKMI